MQVVPPVRALTGAHPAQTRAPVGADKHSSSTAEAVHIALLHGSTPHASVLQQTTTVPRHLQSTAAKELLPELPTPQPC